MEDVAAVVDKDNKRQQALEAWWKLLALNISSSAVGRKVIVEATLNNVREVAMGILEAYEDWCTEKLQKHWLPV